MLYNLKQMKKFIFKIIVFVLLFIPLLLVQADGSPCDPSKEVCNPISATNVNGLVKTILEGVIKIGIPIIALAIIYSGFLFVSAQGNSEKLETAKKSLTYTLIGAAILLGAWAIAQLITETVLAL